MGIPVGGATEFDISGGGVVSGLSKGSSASVLRILFALFLILLDPV